MQLLQCEAPQTGPQGWETHYADRLGTPLPSAWASKLIARLRMLYGTRFLQAWENVDMAELAQHWAEELAGFTGEEIAAGLSACKTRPWPPTLPEFMLLCRPWLEPEVAFRQAVAGMAARRKGKHGYWVHPAVYWTAIKIGEYDMLAGSWQTLKTRWEAAFRHVLSQTNLHPVPDPAMALPEPCASTLSREEASQLAAKLRQMAGAEVMPGSNVTDHKAWVRKILANPKDRTITVIRMAQEALGLNGCQPYQIGDWS